MITVAFSIGNGFFQAVGQVKDTAAIDDAGPDDTGNRCGIQIRPKVSRRNDILNLRRARQTIHRRRKGAEGDDGR